jgi:hypothetical protein
MTSRRRAGWLLTAFFGVAAALSGCASDESTVAQPGAEDPCMAALDAIGKLFGIPELGDLSGTGENTSISNIAIGNGGNVVQTNIGSGSNVNCCVDGECTP